MLIFNKIEFSVAVGISCHYRPQTLGFLPGEFLNAFAFFQIAVVDDGLAVHGKTVPQPHHFPIDEFEPFGWSLFEEIRLLSSEFTELGSGVDFVGEALVDFFVFIGDFFKRSVFEVEVPVTHHGSLFAEI